MPNKKVPEFTELTTVADGDKLYIVDVSDVTDDATGSSRYALAKNVRGYPQTAAETTAGVTVVNAERKPGNVLRYGTNTTPGTTNMYTAFNSAQLQMQEFTGANILIPPDTYLLGSQWTITTPDDKRTKIMAYGAKITGSGAYSGVQLTGGATTGGCTIYGLDVDHRGNATATFGFELFQTWNASLIDCRVTQHDTKAGYSCFLLRNGTASDSNTGCFWTILKNCQVRRRDAVDGAVAECGIRLRGAQNATTIQDCVLGDVTTCIHHTIESGQTIVANALLVAGSSCEGYTTAYHLEGATTSVIGGVRFIGNRFENGTTVYSFTTTTSQPVVPPHFSGNHYVSNAGTQINNPNSLYMNNYDSSVTPSIIPSEINNGVRTIRSLPGNANVLDLQVGGGNKGFRLLNSSGVMVAQVTWTGTGSEGEIRSTSVANLYLSTIQGISQTATKAQNLRGSATFATSGTKAVAFGTNESDTTYFITISGNTNETYWITSKATTGFTVNSSNASSTAVVDWVLIR